MDSYYGVLIYCLSSLEAPTYIPKKNRNLLVQQRPFDYSALLYDTSRCSTLPVIDSSSPAELFGSYDQDFKHIVRGDRLEDHGKPDRENRPLLSTLKSSQRKVARRDCRSVKHYTFGRYLCSKLKFRASPSLYGLNMPLLKQVKTELAKYDKLSKVAHTQLAGSDLLGRSSPMMSAVK